MTEHQWLVEFVSPLLRGHSEHLVRLDENIREIKRLEQELADAKAEEASLKNFVKRYKDEQHFLKLLYEDKVKEALSKEVE